jgi:hypothetical protein
MNSNTYPDFVESDSPTWYIKTGIHHFEMTQNTSTGIAISGTIYTDKAQYVNSSIGSTSGSEKKIVSNYEYETVENDNKRTVYLLRKDYLNEFVDEFEKLINLGDN